MFPKTYRCDCHVIHGRIGSAFDVLFRWMSSKAHNADLDMAIDISGYIPKSLRAVTHAHATSSSDTHHDAIEI